jgi:hypothetical protein
MLEIFGCESEYQRILECGDCIIVRCLHSLIGFYKDNFDLGPLLQEQKLCRGV